MARKEEKTEKKSIYETKYKADYTSDWDVHRQYIANFDAWEAMLNGQVYDSVSKTVSGSKITDSYATTLAKEKADRVVAKLPEGETTSIGSADTGKALFMDIIRQKWTYPNANAQHSFLEKINLWQLYSSVYGYMPMFYDWTVSHTGYVGPDCWLFNPRNLIPQQGRISIRDMEYCTALTWYSKKFLKNVLDNPEEKDGWDREALRELLENLENEAISGNDAEQNTLVERDRTPSGVKKGICLATRYESGEDGNWVTFAPDNGYIQLRKIKNPHKNGRIPFVVKYSQPLFDSFYGLGDFQRAQPLQFARDGLTNFYFANLKRNLAPGIIANANGVVKHTLDVTKANPILLETIPNSIRPLPTNTAGLSTYQGAQSQLTGSLLSLYGTQNASLPGAETLNPEQGKTPAAINMFSDKEATRDGAERRHLESALEELQDGFNSLIVNIGTEDIPINLWYEDIKDIAKIHPDVQQLFMGKIDLDKSGTAAKLVINPKELKGVEYRFNIEPNSTVAVSKEKMLAQLDNLMDRLGKFQNQFKDDDRIDIGWADMMETYETLSDLPNARNFIRVNDAPSPKEKKLLEIIQQQQQQLQEVQTSFEQQKQDESQPPAPVINKGGMFMDPDVGAVANEITNL